MNRKKFIGSLLGLIGVATNIKELAKLGKPKRYIGIWEQIQNKPRIPSESFTIKLTEDWIREREAFKARMWWDKVNKK